MPTIAVMLVQTLVGILETFYLGFLGTDVLAGVALVFPVWMLMTMTSGAGIGSGVGSAIARAFGSGRTADARALVRHAVVLAVGCGLAFTLGALVGGRLLFQALGGHGAALGAALAYSDWVFGAAVPVWIVNILSAALRGAGNVRIPAIVTLSGAMVLIPLSPLLIFGIGPLPGLGVAGAGLAVAIYYSGAALVLLRYIRNGGAGLALAHGRIEPRLMNDILKVGVLASVSALQVNLTALSVTGMVGRFGLEALAGYGLSSRLDYIMTPIVAGVGSAALPMVGMNLGAGNARRAKTIGWNAIAIGGAITEFLGIAAATLPWLWVGLFSTDPAVTAAGIDYLGIVAPVYGALGINVVTNMVGQGGGRPLWPLLAGTTRLIISVGLGWLATTYLHAPRDVLFYIIAAGAATSAAMCVSAHFFGATIRKGKE